MVWWNHPHHRRKKPCRDLPTPRPTRLILAKLGQRRGVFIQFFRISPGGRTAVREVVRRPEYRAVRGETHQVDRHAVPAERRC